MLLRVESQKSGWIVPVVDPRARGAGLGVWAEGAGSLARLAAVDDRLADLRPALDAAPGLRGGTHGRTSGRRRRRGRLPRARIWCEGAWFREDLTRMDDQQHALSGLLAAAGLVGGHRP